MIQETDRRAHEIFREALSLSGARREAFVDESCAGDPALRSEVALLLEAAGRAEGFLETPAIELLSPPHPPAEPADSMIGRRIGGFVILSVIAAGGMGTVFLARQEHPQRTVALKVMRPGIATGAAMRRFDFEARILARLQHPNIAQIFEAGAYDDGRGAIPYFAMEYVDQAHPITEHARTARLSLHERLRLFLALCDAVHHGHRNGVIHRDLKPANILVDRAGTVKVIDFGVARAGDLDPLLTTVRAGAGQLMGTFAYMSPEQAGADAAGADVRSDVYSLGVVLYQMLCGAMPYALDASMPFEAPRIIRERPPDRPSAHDPALRGDIETIIFKALEKDRERRYQSAADLAADIRRYLDRRPISARPPSLAYQAKMFARRNRLLVGSGLLAAILLLLAVAGTGAGLLMARKAERDAVRRAELLDAVSRFILKMFHSAHPEAEGPNVRMLDVLDAYQGQIDARFPNSPEIAGLLHDEVGLSYAALARFDDAEPHLRAAVDLYGAAYGPDHQKTLASRGELANLSRLRGRFDEAERLLRAELEHDRVVLGPDSDLALHVLNNLGLAVKECGRGEEAERIFREAAGRRLETLGPDHYGTTAAMNNLALVLRDRGKLDEAESLYRQVLESDQRTIGADHTDTLDVMNNLASLLRSRGRLDEAEPLFRRVLEVRQGRLGDMHPDVLLSMNNLAMLMVSRRKTAEAEPLLRRTYDAHVRALGANHPSTLIVGNNLGKALIDLGNLTEAQEMFDSVVAGAADAFKPEHPRIAFYRAHQASCWAAQGRREEAEPVLLASFEAVNHALGPDDRQTKAVATLLAALYESWEKPAEAAHWRERAGK